MTRAFVEDIVQTTGYLFDERFFCYCEDTDLALRANLLGYRPAYTDRLIALHQGQASSGAGYNAFIAYYGLRNLLWMHLKLMPSSIVLARLPWVLFGQILAAVRHVLSGHPSILWRVYRDAWRGRHALQLERHAMGFQSRISPVDLKESLSKRFYRVGYTQLVLAQLVQKISRTLTAKLST